MTTIVETDNATETRMVAAIVTAFASDPAVRWLYPEAHQYLTHFPDFVRAFAGKAFEYDTAREVEGIASAALWLPPGVQPDEAAIVNVVQRSVSEPRLS